MPRKNTISAEIFSDRVLGLVDRDRETKQLMYALFTQEHMLLMGPPGTAKCHGKGTKILLYNGEIKNVEDIEMDDLLMGDDSTPRKVISCVTGKCQLYRISPNKGESFVVNEQHILSLKSTTHDGIKKGDILNISIADYLRKSNNFKHTWKLYRVGVNFKTKPIRINPYFLGVWLGDGNSNDVGITTVDKEIIRFIYNEAKRLKLQVTKRKSTTNGNYYSYAITTGKQGGKSNKYCLQKLLQEYNLIKNKHVPLEYKTNSRKIRLQLLAGLIDSDGTKDKSNCLKFVSINKQLAEDVAYLCRSLGLAAYIKPYIAQLKSRNYKVTAYKVSISGDCSTIPVLLKRKKCYERKQKKNVLVTGFTINKARIGDYYGFTLDKNCLYLLGDFTVTHNSLFASRAFQAIDGAKIFSTHLTKQTTEEYIFGPLNIVELKKGNVVHNTKDSILEADFAFIDEFFDASDVLLRSLLGVLNERVWMKGQQRVEAKLHTAILTSNYQRENDVTQAILDRIIFQCEVGPITAKTKRLRVYKNFLKDNTFKVPKVLDLEKLKAFTDKVSDPTSVAFPKPILKIYDELVKDFSSESKKYVSQRTANKALKVLKVSALLNGRSEIIYKDLEELKYALCVLNRRMEEEIFDAVYEKHVGNAEEEQILTKDLSEIAKRFKDIPTNFDQLTDQEFVDKMAEITELIHLLETMKCPTDKTNQKKDKLIEEMCKIVDDNRDKLFKRKA